MKRFIALLAAGCAAFPTHAQSTPDTGFAIGEIVVTARAMAGRPGPGSVDRLGADIAQGADIDHLWELFARLPGVMLTDFNQGTTSGKFSIRGFNGEGEVNAVKLLIDGIPANSNDGNMPFMGLVTPLDIAEVELVRGTADPRWGLHAIAGSANIVTRSGGNYLDARLATGSNATRSAQLAAGRETSRFTQNYALGWRETEGWRDHAHLDRITLGGKWAYRLADDVSLGAIARYARTEAEEPGYLIAADAAARPRMTNAYNATDGGLRRTGQYALTLDAGLGAHLGLSARAYLNRLHDDRFVKFSATAAQQHRFADEDHRGVVAALHYHAAPGLMIEAGGDVQWQDNVSRRWLTANRVATSQTRDQQFTLNVGGAYAQVIWEPAAWIRLTPAFRADWVGGHFSDLRAGTSAPINDYGRIDQPKLGVVLMAGQGLSLFGNWGRSFQIGVGSGAYLVPPRITDLAPSINEGWEIGVRYAPSNRIEARLAGWRQDATGEIKRKLNDPLGDFDNLGATRREGVDLQLSLKPIGSLSLWGAVAWQRAVIRTPDPATPQLAGNAIDHVPAWLVSGGIDWKPVQGWRLALSGNGQSRYHLTTANTQGRYGDYARLDAEIEWAPRPELAVSLGVNNLTDDRYDYVWWDGAQTLHSPADGRTLTIAARLRL